MIEARRFEEEHQALVLAGWCGGTVYRGTAHGHTKPPWHMHTCITPAEVAAESKTYAGIGDWIIRYPDGTVEITSHGSQDGYCTDCGEPLWWQDERLVSTGGLTWCQGWKGEHDYSHWHALPGMAQWQAQAPDGRVCRCLVRKDPHIHQIVPAPETAVARYGAQELARLAGMIGPDWAEEWVSVLRDHTVPGKDLVPLWEAVHFAIDVYRQGKADREA